ncbi:MAG: FtsX-like permease family protein [Planctomycetaceae bacterium]|nr:FtsX-like permease family protein [Planctomycetaceae bacterium]
MSLWRFILDSLRFQWRSNLAVALGVATATAVLTGALLVGDSVRGSLLGLALERLGRIDDVLVTRYFFREQLAAELAATPDFDKDFSLAAPAIVLEASLAQPESGRRASRVNCYGVTSEFWQLGSGAPITAPTGEQIVLNQPLAERLQVQVGDEVILRLPLFGDIPADSALGRKTDTVRNRSLTVAAVIPARGLGEFALRPSQQAPLNAYVPLPTLQRALEEPGRVNAIFVAGRESPTLVAPSVAADARLQHALRPTLADYGLRVEKSPQGVWQLFGEHMLLEPGVEREALRAFAADRPQPVLTYLANTIAAQPTKIPDIDREGIPYSTIAAIDPALDTPLGPFLTPDGQPLARIGDDEIVLNSWAAENLGVRPGQSIWVRYFLPESTHGKPVEDQVQLKLAAIVELAGAAADPDLTPPLKGVTDQESIDDWNPPFPFEAGRIRSDDETYWDNHRATPKGFVSLATGRRLWGSRFGEATSIRFAPDDPQATAASLAARLQLEPVELGFQFRPIKRLALAASAGTTGFSGLFLGFSFFLIVAALMLVLLLFRLAVDQRVAQIGTLAALGWSSRKIRRALAGEGLLVALGGATVGAALGIGYASLLLVGLRTWWVAAISTPFVQLEVRPPTVIVGLLSGTLASFAAIWWALWRMRRAEIRQLLSGQTSDFVASATQPAGWRRAWPWGVLAAALVLALSGGALDGEARAGTFFGSGALVLTGLLALVARRMRDTPRGATRAAAQAPLWHLAGRNAARNPLRSTLTIGLIAAAAFLLIAISAFRLSPPGENQRSSGTGGFALIAESDQPIYEDLEPLAGRLNAPPERGAVSSTAGAEVKIYPLRLRPGDDASCLNLYQASQPRLLGVSDDFIRRGGFSWSQSSASDPATRANPWLLLERDWGKTPDGRRLVPAVVDANTATYSLHLSGLGAIYELPDGRGGSVPLQIVGLLKNSLLQGSLIVAERALLREFPEVSGARVFLVDAPAERAAEAALALDDALGDYGFASIPATQRLAEFMVVQNTYLETFQSLGGLGLLLGTLGIAAVQLRNVWERRGELALLRAVGFARRRLAATVLLENVLLVAGGLLLGTLAALVAILPHLWGESAAIPWRSLAAMLGLVLAAGVLASVAAVRATLRAPMIGALRGE